MSFSGDRFFEDEDQAVKNEQVGLRNGSNNVSVSLYEWWKPVVPLYKRAWVLQEQALLGRTLVFSSDSLH